MPLNCSRKISAMVSGDSSLTPRETPSWLSAVMMRPRPRAFAWPLLPPNSVRRHSGELNKDQRIALLAGEGAEPRPGRNRPLDRQRVIRGSRAGLDPAGGRRRLPPGTPLQPC